MQSIELNGVEVFYDLTFKDNKNTYFYFKDDGHIKINASRFQTEKQIINHMINNSDQFLLKLDKVKQRQIIPNHREYLLWGKTLKKMISRNKSRRIRYDDNCIFYPDIFADQQDIVFEYFEKKEVLKELHNLYDFYKDNPYVDISNITLKTRYTKTRFGSCNAFKRNININTHLVHYDKKYIEYVFLHEISHLTHQNHGPLFYELLEKLSPNYKQLRKEIKQTFRR